MNQARVLEESLEILLHDLFLDSNYRLSAVSEHRVSALTSMVQVVAQEVYTAGQIVRIGEMSPPEHSMTHSRPGAVQVAARPVISADYWRARGCRGLRSRRQR